jgi:hypothetical protein
VINIISDWFVEAANHCSGDFTVGSCTLSPQQELSLSFGATLAPGGKLVIVVDKTSGVSAPQDDKRPRPPPPPVDLIPPGGRVRAVGSDQGAVRKGQGAPGRGVGRAHGVQGACSAAANLVAPSPPGVNHRGNIVHMAVEAGPRLSQPPPGTRTTPLSLGPLSPPQLTSAQDLGDRGGRAATTLVIGEVVLFHVQEDLLDPAAAARCVTAGDAGDGGDDDDDEEEENVVIRVVQGPPRRELWGAEAGIEAGGQCVWADGPRV